MKSTVVAVTLALAALAPFAAGCGTIDYDHEAEYPQQAVGYTPPQTAAAVAPPQVQPQAMPEGQGEGEPDPNAIAEVQQQSDTAIGATSDEYADTDPSALTDFRSTLDPYGTWVDDGTYGTVWVPSQSVVGSDFSPYVSAGHWTYDTDYTWVSDYSWGWAPFHYGRWTYIGNRGWGWIPGRTYAGAWVTWRVGYDDWGYVGWAPLPPTYYWNRGYAYGLSVRPYAPYAFCGHGDLFYRGQGGLNGRLVTGSQVGVVAGHTRPYVPASPTVGAGGHVGAHPTVATGPSPSSMKIPSHAVTPPPVGDRGLTQAQAFSHASTAAAMGARPPAQSMAHNAPARGAGGTTGGPAGNVGGSRPSAATSQPYARGTAPQTGSAYSRTAPAYSHTPPTSGYRPSTPGYRPPVASYSHPAPTYRAPSYSPPATYRPSPGYSAPHASTPSYGSTPHYGSAPSAGSHYSAPSGGTYHAPSGGSTSHPSTGGGYHPSGGGGGGFHGGGGGGRGGRR